MSQDYTIYTNLPPEELNDIANKLIGAFPDLLRDCHFNDRRGEAVEQAIEKKDWYNLDFTPTSQCRFRYKVHNLDDCNPLDVVEWTALFYYLIGRKNCAIIFVGEYVETFFGGSMPIYEDGQQVAPPDLYIDILPKFLEEYREHFKFDVYHKKHVLRK